jgi:hypothetical protein
LSQWKTLCTVNNQMEGEILKGYLESHGIRAVLRSEAAGEIYGLTAGPLAEVDVLVAFEQYEEAERILEEYPEDET